MFFLFKLFALTSLAQATIPAELLTAPEFEVGENAPYTAEWSADLTQLFASERVKHLEGLSKKLSKAGRAEKLYAAYEIQNDLVRAKLSETKLTGVATTALIESSYTSLANHPVAKVSEVAKYDSTGDLGLCFGRALLVHQLLRKANIPQAQIAKIFVVGKLKHQDLLWDFHVATIVRTAQSDWWAIDSLYEKPLPVAEWTVRAKKLGANQRFPEGRFFVTDPRKFHAAHGKYLLSDLQDPSLWPFFSKLLTSF